jgi:2-(1,2-epoxy-1,2-dihydrophenyl)acetyl-CoA isomerase
MASLLRSHVDGVLTLALNRPDKLNAFDDALATALLAALTEAGSDPTVRVVVLTGSERAFSAGQDLDELFDAEAGLAHSVREHLRASFNRIAIALRTIDKPVIAAVGGVAAGVGLSLALACDLRFAADDARFTLGFSRIGLIPDGGASVMLPLLIGLGRALELAWTSDVIDAAEAHRIGLVNRVVPAISLGDDTAAFARKLAGMSGSAVALTKRAMNAAIVPQLAAVLEGEAELQERAASSPDVRAGVRAFRERRAQAR